MTLNIKIYAILFLTSALGFASNASTGLSKLAGVYKSDEGNQFVVSIQGRSVRLRTNAELSRYNDCRTPLTLISKSTSSDDGFAEAMFNINSSQCPGIDGPIVLHYNLAPLTGVDVYLVDVVVREGHGRSQGQTMRWHLTKVR